VSTLENAVGKIVFTVAAASVVWVTYMEYAPNMGMTVLRKTNMNFVLAPPAALLIFCAARYHGAVFRLLKWRPVIALGEASYLIYLVHLVVLTAAARLIASAGHSILYGLTELLVLVFIILLI
jgi:peptidoglycan/LPS O-acetylase OafA/YrhL